jgi:Tfp pilus assembly protein PilX
MVLLLCLIFLTALTLLGLSASAEAILQNKLTANLRESEHAKQSALSALSFAENWLLKLEGVAPESCSTACTGLKLHAQGDLPTSPEFKDLSWWETQGHEAGIDPQSGVRISSLAGSSMSPPFWIIEAVHESLPAENGTTDLQVWYRVLARGSGRTNAGVSVVESIVVRSWTTIETPETSETETEIRCPGAETTAKCGRVAWRELR